MEVASLLAALSEVRTAVVDARYPLAVPSAGRAAVQAQALVAQLDDYLLPRVRNLDAPLLAVVGGPPGGGKSTLVNSLVRAPVSPAGVLRPTTRVPVLLCHPADMPWFAECEVLPGLNRTSRPGAGALRATLLYAAMLRAVMAKEAVRELGEHACGELLVRVGDLLAAELGRRVAAVAATGADHGLAYRLRGAAAHLLSVREAPLGSAPREGTPWSGPEVAPGEAA